MTEPVTADNITRQFLYGSNDTPILLTQRLRNIAYGASGASINIDTESYMNTYGKYAVPARAAFVKDFFTGTITLSPGTYTVENLKSIYGDAPFRFGFLQATVDIGNNNYMDRAYIFGHVGFSLSDSTEFVVSSTGNLSMNNVSIIPENDNFDFVSTGASQILNENYLQPTIDASEIGRQVLMNYVGTSPVFSYSGSDYTADVGRIASWDGTEAAAVAVIGANIIPYVEAMRANGVFETSRNGRKIVYDGTQSNDLTSDSTTGAIFVGGAGDDLIHGTASNDLAYGGADNDIFLASGGNDDFWGGDESGQPFYNDTDTVDYSASTKRIALKFDGNASSLTVETGFGTNTLHSIEKVIGTDLRDNFVFVGDIAAGTNLTINAGNGATDDIINFAAGGPLSLDIGAGTIQSKVTNGIIHLENFHTKIIGSSYGDDITDNSSGSKRIDGGDGDDQITATGGSAYVDGGSGDDIIIGGGYNDILVGADGENELSGGGGADRLFASANSNILDGGDGDDMLVISKEIETAKLIGGEGNDVIDARANHAHDYLDAFGGRQLSSPEEGVYFTFKSGDGNDVLLGNGYDNLTPGIDLHSYLNVLTTEQNTGLGWGVDAIVFEDLSIKDVTFVWDVTSVSSWVDASEWNPDADTYIVASGNLAIVVNATGDSIYLGNVTGSLVAPDEETLLVGEWGEDDVYRVDKPQLYSITLPSIYFTDEQMWWGGAWTNGHFQIGSVSQYNTALSDHQTATAGSNGGEVEGTSGDDNLEGGSGNDSVAGGTGNDDYQASGGDDTFDGGDGDDTLTVFGQISGFDFHWQEDGSVLATSHSGLEGKTKLISVEQVYSIAEDQSYALGDLAGGFGTSGNDSLISGTSRNDHLFGLAGNDILLGGAGDDLINGGDGTDTARYAGNSSDYMVYLNATGGLTVKALAGTDGVDELVDIENIEFVGDSVTMSTLDVPALGTSSADIVQGNARANHLFGLGGDDVLDGGAGNDILEGGSGDDTYLISSGDGNDVIVEGTVQDVNHDVLDLSWLDPEDIVLTRAGGMNDAGDLLIRVVSTGDVIRVVGQFADPYWDTNGIEEILFDGSVTWDRQAIRDNANLVGTSGNDVLYGTDYSATIEGKGGDDTIYGFWGSDTILFGANDGHDTFIGIQNGATLKLVGLDSGDVTMERDGSNLIVTVTATGATMTVVDQFPAGGYGYGLGAIEFATEGTFSIDQLVGDIFSPPINGTSGNDALWGTMLQDVINGGDGDDELHSVGYALPDTLNGGAGNDQLYGHDLDDVLNGGDDDDLLMGSYGNDTLDGGAGTDRLIGGVGDDLLVGGTGSADVAVYEGLQSSFGIATVNGTVTITDNAPSSNGDEGTDSLSGIEVAEFQGGIQAGISSPIILDLNGNGVTLVDNKRTNVGFDWDGDGAKNQTGWIGKDDGFLFIDRDGNGTVTNAGELSFTSDKEGAKSDLDGLRAFDSNGDGIFSSADDQFAQFKVWRDKNGNGRVDKKEILSLQKAGVASIDLTGEAVNQSWEWGENITVNTGSFTRTNGIIGSFSDVALSYDTGTSQNTAINKAASQLSEAMAGFWDGLGTAAFGKFEALAERRDNFLAADRGEWR